jgi:hypothetical protein
VQPARFHSIEGEQIYYAAVFSYGEKPRTGVFYLLDNNGRILQRLDDRDFREINGITDVDRDGTHELIVFIGSVHGGGVEVYVLEWDEREESVRLSSARYLQTVFD